MKHFTFSIFSKEVFSFTWGDVLIIEEDEAEDTEQAKPKAKHPFGFK